MMPYVPDGLSPEQYAALKAKEQKKASEKNYGAWGPRFQPTDAPFWATEKFLTKSGAFKRKTQQEQEMQLSVLARVRMGLMALLRTLAVGLLAALAAAASAAIFRRASREAVACAIALHMKRVP
eukprot:CAMPEP_0119069484 /NCGR_PEP_ID=MMETSP1178-20130426/19589_1 /TAXON_ID=33656 /ORGANISM="unid sp, Strain CCMP2000" /LENGTH=123 /DNA_ID=CAMNT_0007051253 /DNA_START=188 /DNA_END=559 /DNA_ORIENTATION=+